MTDLPLGLREGFTVLFVEDNSLLAIDGEDTLKLLGVSRVELANTVDAAHQVIERCSIDAAFLDLKLGDQSSLVIAEQLMARTVPFAFATGYSDAHAIPDRYSHVLVVEKPYTSEQIKHALLALTKTMI
jgi:DNA-binding NtrC family response regulator